MPFTLPDQPPGADVYPSGTEFPSVLVDPEFLIRAWLQTQFPDALVCTETDETLATTPWTIKVGAGGGSGRFTLRHPRVVLDTFAPTRDAARKAALLADHAMCWLLRGQRLGGVAVVSKVEQLSGPIRVPDVNTKLRHFAATYVPTFSPLA